MIIFWILGGVVILLVVVLAILAIVYRIIYKPISKWEWLEIITYQWKIARDLKDEMAKKMGCRISAAEPYLSVSLLEDRGLVERRMVDHPDPRVHRIRQGAQVVQFRLTSEGGRKKEELESKEDIGILGVLS